MLCYAMVWYSGYNIFILSPSRQLWSVQEKQRYSASTSTSTPPTNNNYAQSVPSATTTPPSARATLYGYRYGFSNEEIDYLSAPIVCHHLTDHSIFHSFSIISFFPHFKLPSPAFPLIIRQSYMCMCTYRWMIFIIICVDYQLHRQKQQQVKLRQ
jgi:hypothetical protein